MPSIVVNNSCIMVKDYIMGDCRELEKHFMIYNPLTHSYNILGMYYSVKSSTLYLPRGIDLYFVKKCLGIKYHKVEDPDPYEETGVIRIKYKPAKNKLASAVFPAETITIPLPSGYILH